MNEDQQALLFARIQRALIKAEWFVDDGGKIVITFPKRIAEKDRQIKVTAIREDIFVL